MNKIKKINMGADIEIELTAKITLLGKIGFIFMKIGAWILSKSVVSYKIGDMKVKNV